MVGRNYIREWRRYRGMKQETLAERSGLSLGTISQIESGKQGYSRESLEAIARVLQVPPGNLLSVHPDPSPNGPTNTN